MGNVMVIKLRIHLSREAKERLRADIQRQLAEGGPVIIPKYMDVIYVPDDVDVELEDLPGGQNHFIGGEYYDGKKSKNHRLYET